MNELLAHPDVLLVLAWVGSRFQILVEVRARVGAAFRFRQYLNLRGFQIIHSIAWTGLAYGLLSATDMLDPITAVAAGVGADQVIDRITGAVVKGGRSGGEPGTSPSDLTVIAREMTDPEATVLRDEA